MYEFNLLALLIILNQSSESPANSIVVVQMLAPAVYQLLVLAHWHDQLALAYQPSES